MSDPAGDPAPAVRTAPQSAPAPGGLLAGGPAALVAAAAPALVGLVAFALARSVLLPGQGFWDTGEFQAVPPLLGTAHPTGYPTYVLLGWLTSLVLAPLGEPAFRMNLLSAALLALAAALVVVLVRRLAGRTSVAIGAGLLFALTPIPWRMGAFADPHTLHLALIALLLAVLVGWEERRRTGVATADRWLVGAAVLYGVMLGNHTLTVLLAPGIALFVLAVEPRIVLRLRFVGLCAAALLGTLAALYLELPIRAAMGAPLVYGRPDTLDGFLYVVSAEQFRGDLVDAFGGLGRKLADLVALASEQLGLLAVLVPPAFLLAAVRRPRFALLTAAWLVVTCWFAASYTNASIERYYLGPALIVVTWLGIAAGVVVDALAGERGADDVEADSRSASADDSPVDDSPVDDAGADETAVAGPDEPATRRVVPRVLAGVLPPLVGVALAVGLVLPAALAAPTTATKVDQSRDTRAADWSRWVLETVERDAVIVSWWSYSTPLWYRTLVLGERPDVWVVDDRDRLDESLGSIDDVIRSALGRRPVYLVRNPDEMATLEAAWQIEVVSDPRGQQPLYRVVAPRDGSGRRPVGPSGMAQPLPATMAPC